MRLRIRLCELQVLPHTLPVCPPILDNWLWIVFWKDVENNPRLCRGNKISFSGEEIKKNVLIGPKMTGLIVKNHRLDEVTAARLFYESRVYSLLEQEDTKLWHLSPLTLFNMYDEERKTGNITFPEG